MSIAEAESAVSLTVLIVNQWSLRLRKGYIYKNFAVN
jgi:hypothetical protein